MSTSFHNELEPPPTHSIEEYKLKSLPWVIHTRIIRIYISCDTTSRADKIQLGLVCWRYHSFLSLHCNEFISIILGAPFYNYRNYDTIYSLYDLYTSHITNRYCLLNTKTLMEEISIHLKNEPDQEYIIDIDTYKKPKSTPFLDVSAVLGLVCGINDSKDVLKEIQSNRDKTVQGSEYADYYQFIDNITETITTLKLTFEVQRNKVCYNVLEQLPWFFNRLKHIKNLTIGDSANGQQEENFTDILQYIPCKNLTTLHLKNLSDKSTSLLLEAINNQQIVGRSFNLQSLYVTLDIVRSDNFEGFIKSTTGFNQLQLSSLDLRIIAGFKTLDKHIDNFQQLFTHLHAQFSKLKYFGFYIFPPHNFETLISRAVELEPVEIQQLLIGFIHSNTTIKKLSVRNHIDINQFHPINSYKLYHQLEVENPNYHFNNIQHLTISFSNRFTSEINELMGKSKEGYDVLSSNSTVTNLKLVNTLLVSPNAFHNFIQNSTTIRKIKGLPFNLQTAEFISRNQSLQSLAIGISQKKKELPISIFETLSKSNSLYYIKIPCQILPPLKIGDFFHKFQLINISKPTIGRKQTEDNNYYLFSRDNINQ